MRKGLSFVMLVLLTGSAVTVSATSDYPPPTNIRITDHYRLQNEEQVVICPTDSNIIITNWRDFRLGGGNGYRQIGIGRSTDGGLTWTDSLVQSVLQSLARGPWSLLPYPGHLWSVALGARLELGEVWSPRLLPRLLALHQA